MVKWNMNKPKDEKQYCVTIHNMKLCGIKFEKNEQGLDVFMPYATVSSCDIMKEDWEVVED